MFTDPLPSNGRPIVAHVCFRGNVFSRCLAMGIYGTIRVLRWERSTVWSTSGTKCASGVGFSGLHVTRYTEREEKTLSFTFTKMSGSYMFSALSLKITSDSFYHPPQFCVNRREIWYNSNT
jgi:hypothetical protein